MATHPKLRTVSGEPVRAFALGGNRETRQRSDVVTEAYARGVNYFFAYSMDDASIGDYLDGLRVLCSDPRTRRRIFVAVGMEDFTDREKVTDHVAKCLARLGTDYVDAFYMEYVCRGDEDARSTPSSGCAARAGWWWRTGRRARRHRRAGCVSWGAARTTGASG